MADSNSSTEVLLAFRSAWIATARDYTARRLNSERCLQAHLFFHLKKKLPSEYSIFVEATIKIPNQSRIAIDMIIYKEDTVFSAIEIKFSPKGQSRLAGIRKDILSLSNIRNRRGLNDRVKIEIARYRNDDAGLQSLKVDRTCKLIFAAIGKADGKRLNETQFWPAHAPKSGRWMSKKKCPGQFGVALTHTDEAGGAKPLFFGPPFDRLNIREVAS